MHQQQAELQPTWQIANPSYTHQKHKQTKTHTAETDHKQPPSTATSRLLLPEERQPRAILKTRARPLQPGVPETQVHSPNQGYLHPHPHPVSHRRLLLLLFIIKYKHYYIISVEQPPTANEEGTRPGRDPGLLSEYRLPWHLDCE